ncbi:MAG: hypothetical protein U0Y82_05920 [Thermoleophilia bacterium]
MSTRTVPAEGSDHVETLPAGSVTRSSTVVVPSRVRSTVSTGTPGQDQGRKLTVHADQPGVASVDTRHSGSVIADCRSGHTRASPARMRPVPVSQAPV